MIEWYLAPMTQLELDYPGVTFIYMTGHSDGTGEEGNLHLRNQQIRDYGVANNKVLYDFYNIELYDPDGAYYGDKYVNDNCDYDPDGGEYPSAPATGPLTGRAATPKTWTGIAAIARTANCLTAIRRRMPCGRCGRAWPDGMAG